MTYSDILDKYRAGYKAAKEYMQPVWSRRTHNFALYIGTLPQRAKPYANFHVPYVATLLENVHPLLAQRLPDSHVQARNSDRDRDGARLMNALLDYTFNVNAFDLTFVTFQKESMLFDTAWIEVCWNYEDSETDHASITLLNTFDVLPHPRKVTLDDRWPIFIRQEMTKAEMIEEGWDKRAINSLGDSKLETPSYRRSQLQAMGYTTAQQEKSKDKSDDLYEVVKVWGKMDLSQGKDENAPEEMGYVVFANDEKIINTKPLEGKRQFESPYSHGKIPLSMLPYEMIPHMLLGRSFIDPVASQQEELNVLENYKVDNYKRRNNPPLKVVRAGNVDLSTLKYLQSLPWLMNTLQDVEPFVLPDLAPSIESQQNMIRAQMQGRTGANDVLLVSDYNNIKGGDTATGASIANENTKARFRPQATLIDIAIERIGELLISLYQDKNFFDRPKAIAIADDEGQYYETMVRPDQIQGDLQFKVISASSLAESNLEKLQKFVNLKELYIQDPSINQDELDKGIFDAADIDYNKVKRTMQDMGGDAESKLKQLIALTQRPGFDQAPEQQKQQILAAIQQLRDHLGQMQQGQPGQPAPQEATQPQQEQVPTQGGLQ